MEVGCLSKSTKQSCRQSFSPCFPHAVRKGVKVKEHQRGSVKRFRDSCLHIQWNSNNQFANSLSIGDFLHTSRTFDRAHAVTPSYKHGHIFCALVSNTRTIREAFILKQSIRTLKTSMDNAHYIDWSSALLSAVAHAPLTHCVRPVHKGTGIMKVWIISSPQTLRSWLYSSSCYECLINGLYPLPSNPKFFMLCILVRQSGRLNNIAYRAKVDFETRTAGWWALTEPSSVRFCQSCAMQVTLEFVHFFYLKAPLRQLNSYEWLPIAQAYRWERFHSKMSLRPALNPAPLGRIEVCRALP